ncbi:MAG: thiamine-phosphate pyrophosphorylase [Candidatus Omnitrophica bacterium]|nr:thiamine-phosphate pyrophosphorylase [Candidatus Omnitrophota bacterium]
MREALRIIDANLNRSSEGIRVCEDIARFALNDRPLTRSLKKVRQDTLRCAKKIECSSGAQSLKFRNTLKDVGKKSSRRELRRRTLTDIFRANAQRAKESLRSLEEVSKLLDKNVSKKFKRLRFKVYELEKRSRLKLESLLDN